jgi:2-polyprenyl-6-methoxyphenol hydroxylase-like FAD-dependent oxidoreductase
MSKPVLVVGAGPVGLTTASELARYGVPVRIVEKAAARTDKSKALVLWSRTLELLDRGGAAGAAPFVAAGLQCPAVNLVTAEKVVGRIGFDKVGSVYPYGLMLPQSETERLLEERLAEQGVVVERQVELVSFDRHDGGVEAVLRHAGEREEAVSAGWLLACDGAHSTVRHGLGIPFTGETLVGEWFLADVHLRGYPFPEGEVAIYWHRDGALAFFPIAPGRYRVIADLPACGEDHPAEPTLEQVQAIMDQRGPGGMVAFDPIWLSAFRVNSRKVSDYRHGRVFLAGDAAHIHSPAGGQGMNTGMQDAFNLAWKLAQVVRGACGEQLLDSYSAERSAVGDQVLRTVGRLTTIGTLHSPVAQGLRNVVGHLVLGLAPVREAVAANITEVSVGYPDSPLNGPGLRGGPAPGTRFAPASEQDPVGAGNAPLFTLFAERTPAIEELVQQFGKLISQDVRPPPCEGALWLVRPDGYVACSSDDPADIATYLRRLADPAGAQRGMKLVA